MFECTQENNNIGNAAMGRITTPKYRIETGSDKRGWVTLSAWNSRSYGPANAGNLETYRVRFNQSFLKGGVNDHIASGNQPVPYYSNLRIVEQKTGRVVAVAHGPAFEIVEPPVHAALLV